MAIHAMYIHMYIPSAHLVAGTDTEGPGDAGLNVSHPFLPECVRVGLYHTRSPWCHNLKAESSVQIVCILDSTHPHVLSYHGVLFIFAFRLIHQFVVLENKPSF